MQHYNGHPRCACLADNWSRTADEMCEHPGDIWQCGEFSRCLCLSFCHEMIKITEGWMVQAVCHCVLLCSVSNRNNSRSPQKGKKGFSKPCHSLTFSKSLPLSSRSSTSLTLQGSRHLWKSVKKWWVFFWNEMRRSSSKIPRPSAEFKTTEVESVLLLEKYLVAGCVTVLTSPLAIYVWYTTYTLPSQWGELSLFCLIFDLTSEHSFANCSYWMEKVVAHCQGLHIPGDISKSCKND